jgi:hypothetical protein
MSPNSLTRQEKAGDIQTYAEAVAHRSVVTVPGSNPPSHALTMIAGK